MRFAWKSIKNNGELLFAQIGEETDKVYLFLLCLYLISNTLWMVGWKSFARQYIWIVYQGFFICVMWLCTVYVFYIIVKCKNAWNNTPSIIITGIILFVLTALISRILTTDSYIYVMGIFFCLMAYGKNYRKILKCILIVISSTLLLGFISMLLGISRDVTKPGREFGGHSLGIRYPNNFGFLMFAVLILVWYLYLDRKKVMTVLMFWSSAVFMNQYITCRTATYLSILFPLSAILAEMLHDRIEIGQDDVIKKRKCQILNRLLVTSPFLVFIGMMVLCWQMDWVHDTLYNTGVHTFAMRFVEGGYALKVNGVTLFGHPFQQTQEIVVTYLDEIDSKYDSAFVVDLILRGSVWMFVTLLWIAVAHRKCLKNKDYRLLVLSLFMLFLSVMEQPGLDVWYNGVLLYPLAAPCRYASDEKV